MKYITPADQAANQREVHPSQRQIHIKPVSAPLYVVTAYSNTQRFYSRQKLYHAFAKMCADAGAILLTVELAFRDRHFEVTEPGNPFHIQLRSPAEVWHKENLLNIGLSRLPADCEYVAWVDADVSFARPDWVTETIHQLQHFKVVQMFSHAQDVSPVHDLGPDFQMSRPMASFAHSYMNGLSLENWSRGSVQAGIKQAQQQATGCSGYSTGAQWWLWHTGYAWAARRSAIADLGGLGDIAALGSADHHMAAALVGRVEETIAGGMQPSYWEYWRQWQALADRHIAGNIGSVPGLLLHYWHGPKTGRKYIDRWKILVDNKFDHNLDLKYDIQGVLALTERNRGLRDGIMAYFRQRNEDSIEV